MSPLLIFSVCSLLNDSSRGLDRLVEHLSELRRFLAGLNELVSAFLPLIPSQPALAASSLLEKSYVALSLGVQLLGGWAARQVAAVLERPRLFEVLAVPKLVDLTGLELQHLLPSLHHGSPKVVLEERDLSSLTVIG